MKSSGGRKAAFLLALALLPPLIPAALGFRSIRSDAVEAERRARERSREAARAVDAELAERLTGLARRLEEELASARVSPGPRLLRRRLESLAALRGEVGIAFHVDRDDGLLLPDGRVFPVGVRPTRAEREGFEEFLRSAREAEEAGSASWARIFLEQARDVITNDDLEALLEWELALLAMAGDDRAEDDRIGADRFAAVGHLRRIFESWPGARDLDGVPLALRAWPRLSELLARLEAPSLPAEAPLLALARGLALDRWELKAVVRETHWTLTLKALEELAERPAGELALRRSIMDIKALREFHDLLRSRARDEIRRVLEAESGPAPREAVRVELSALGRTHLFVVAPLEAEDQAAFVGFEVRLDRLSAALERRIAGLADPFAARVAVLAGDRFVAGDAALAAQSGPAEGRRLVGSIRSWRAVAEPRDPGAPLREARRRSIIVGLLVLSCVGIALLGAVLTVRSVDREVALAETRSRLVRNVSHELRTPVASVRMLAEILEDGGLPEERQQEYVRRIARESRRLGDLVENILSLANIEQGRQALNLEPVELGPRVAGIVEGFVESRPAGERPEIEVDDRGAGAVCAVDAAALDQVLTNLLSNAVKYGRGSPIQVSVAGAGAGEVCLRVRDGGPGIPAEVRPRLFDPFFREREEVGDLPGIGVGLTLVRELVRAHGGRVAAVDPGAEGGGCFEVHLPTTAR